MWSEKEEGRIIRNWSKYERFVDSNLVEMEVFDYHERFYDREEFEAMLHEAGFSNVMKLASWDKSQVANHEWLVFSGQKP